jgi:nitrogen fixation protein
MDGRVYWSELPIPPKLRKVTRCDGEGKSDKNGRWWKVEYRRDKSRNRITGGLEIFAPYKDLAERIIKKSNLNLQERDKYINLRNKRVKAQLHPSSNGVDLAIREADGDENLPKCKFLKPVSIENLNGYWGANKDWLEGNGKRFTNQPAAAFHIPGEIENDAEYPAAWKEVEVLLEYARTRDR